MKVRPPKLWQDLDRSQRKAIQDFAVQVALEEARKQEQLVCKDALVQYIKVACLLLHDMHGMSEEDLICFVGTHLRYFKKQNKLILSGEQEDFLNQKLAEIFPQNGFPQHFVDELVAPVELIDDPKEKKDEVQK